MADSTISALTALAGADTADGDLYTVVDVSASANKKQTLTEARVALFKSAYTQLPGALEAALGFVVNEAGNGKTFYGSHGAASINEGATSRAPFTWDGLTHTFKVGVNGEITALAISADGTVTIAGEDVVTVLTELVGGLNALLLYLGISPAVLVDDDGNPIIDQNGNLIIG